MPADETFINWKDSVPDDFMFVIKANRFITHIKKLRDPTGTLIPFLQKVELLGNKLGAVLFQLPPFLKVNVEILENFIALLPSHNMYIFEFRNTSWYIPEVYKVLKRIMLHSVFMNWQATYHRWKSQQILSTSGFMVPAKLNIREVIQMIS